MMRMACGTPVMGVLCLWTLLLLPAPTAARESAATTVLEWNLSEVAAQESPWSRINFSPEIPLQLTTGTEGGVDYLRLAAEAEGMSIYSIHRPLDDYRSEAGRHLLRVKYRGDVDGPIHFCISTSPGQGTPSIAQKAHYLGDGQWHWAELEFELDGFAPRELILEFGPWGLVAPGHYMDLAELRLDFEPASALRSRLRSPGTGALPGGEPDQKVLLDILMERGEGPLEVHAEAAVYSGGDPVTSVSRVLSGSGTLELDLAGVAPGYYRVLVRAGADRLLGDYVIWKSPPPSPPATRFATTCRMSGTSLFCSSASTMPATRCSSASIRPMPQWASRRSRAGRC